MVILFLLYIDKWVLDLPVVSLFYENFVESHGFE